MTITGYVKTGDTWTICMSAVVSSVNIARDIIQALMEDDHYNGGMIKFRGHTCIRDEDDNYIIDGELVERYYAALDVVDEKWKLI